MAEFHSRWTGRLLLVTSRASLAGKARRFDLTWFIPSLVKYRRLFGEVLVSSFFLQLFALMTPIFFQVVIDKVLVHRSWSTLDVRDAADRAADLRLQPYHQPPGRRTRGPAL
jgi:subfamily B ATP-binding cassette protein HlyB/CyaB